MTNKEAQDQYKSFRARGGNLDFNGFLSLYNITIEEEEVKPAKKKEEKPVLKEVVGDDVNTDEGPQELKED